MRFGEMSSRSSKPRLEACGLGAAQRGRALARRERAAVRTKAPLTGMCNIKENALEHKMGSTFSLAQSASSS